MPNHDFEPNDLARIARDHLESLRQAGIDWLPAPSAAREERVETITRSPVIQAPPMAPKDANHLTTCRNFTICTPPGKHTHLTLRKGKISLSR